LVGTVATRLYNRVPQNSTPCLSTFIFVYKGVYKIKDFKNVREPTSRAGKG